MVPWNNQNGFWWNETCADIVEQFGLPGGKYTTQVSTDCMDFTFYSNQDALLCQILLSEKL